MKKQYKTILCLLMGAAVLTGCDDFLDVDSRKDTDINDQELVTPEAYVNGIYGMLTEWDYAFSYLGVTEMLSDNADKGSSPSDTGGDKKELDDLQFTSSSGSFDAMWANWYKAIGRASYAIEYTEGFGLTDEGYKNRLIGEAKFLRAYNYFFLVRGFGDVPLQHVSLTERVPKEEVYAYIEADLLDAINTLPNKSDYESKDLGRATKGAAQALLAKVYLYEKKWQQAYDMAQTVIGSGQYSLENDYATLWRVTTENGVESIFEVQARGEVVAHGVQQYSETQGARGTSGWGWGFNTPSQNLLDAYNAAGDDIRRDATIIFAGETLYDGRIVSAAVENPMYNEKAYSSANAGAGDGDKNIRVLRLAEIHLIAAEAANELGNTAAALTNLNIVRLRVNLGEVTDTANLRQAIWNERRLELAFEHDRWFDLVRTGQAASAMQAAGKNFIVGTHELFPIPYNQLIQTPTMTQNPNY
ncbi:RagB/SusD family nutrient uptake outer membrane protein [Flavobacterium sp. DG1-102-2]|uniref:RagB/SusD family nutrient uptake outer membrane protein n=1 Tax=Flavobacterium sp. DG1-102-2 TaxID=3081663 RepID=UPI0029498CAB|nr:RagB/SusD family nutrient uptake outer membrane protein [Flavobacterium sp. DG1-102-2]MDV6168139.1 RagB/SusD family nutrient uptake outer membrane protein [Flavobacterium sp. DG1-102-2]